MATFTVGPNSQFPSIAAAMIAAGPSDTILLETGYSNEAATVTHSGMTISGDSTSTGIVLQLGTGIATVFLTGTAPINILDAGDGSGITANAGNNVVTVSGGVDAVNGGLGTDTLVVAYGGATGAVTGDSTSNFTEAGGGAASVTITAGTFENFNVTTGSGADTLTVGNGTNVIRAGGGANTITAGDGQNDILGGNGTDTITAGDGGNLIDGGDGAGIITSGAGNDVILTGVVGADTIVAGGGIDSITVRGGSDTVDSGAGDDRLTVDYSAMTTAVTGGVTGGNLGSGYTAHVADTTINLVDTVATENFTITTGSGNDVITTGDGADSLTGGGGNDTLDASGGSDLIFGMAGDDTLIGGTASPGAFGAYNQLTGGDGTDTASFAFATTKVYADLTIANGYIADGGGTLVHNATFNTIENLLGGSAADTLVGDANSNLLTGGGGADVLFGMAGNDTLVGGATGGTFNQLWGGDGSDTASYASATTAVYADLTIAKGYVANGGGALIHNDSYNSIENLVGGTAADTLVGNASANLLTGNGAADVLFGMAGDDILVGGTAAGSYNQLFGGDGLDTASYAFATTGVYADLNATAGWVRDGGGTLIINDTYNSIENLLGGSAADSLVGDGANNVLTGGASADILYGRAGADTFVYTSATDSNLTAGYDTIADFQTGVDTLDLSAFGIDASRVTILTAGTDTVLYANTDLSTPGNELAIAFQGANAISNSDIRYS